MIEYDKDAIVPPYITTFLRNKTIHDDELLHELEDYALQNSIPIAEPETARFISVISGIIRPKRILEIGTAIGYSAIILARTLADGGEITTIEYNPEMAQKAQKNIKRAKLEDKINVINADAKEYLPTASGKYDMIFLDGPKAHYIYMLEDCIRLLNDNGVIIADNVLYKGMVPDDNHVVRRKITIVKRLRKFIDALMQDKRLETTLISLGDGITVSRKL